jgi:osmotically-inducible protein OsmY
MIRISLRLSAIVLAASALAASLTACVPLVMGGAAMTGMVATDRRTSGAQLEDEGIELRAASRVREAMGERGHINVTSYNRQVLLTGEVPSEQDKQNVEQVVSRVPNVKAIVNELAVLGNSTLAARSADTLVTGKVKASLVDSKDLFANAFKVVTERGTVYLLGRVTPREAERGTAVTRSVGGVLRVVRVFESITEDELKQMLPAPAAAK